MIASLLASVRVDAQQGQREVGIRSLMTLEEFQAAGLQRLDSAQFEALNSWFVRTVSKLNSASKPLSSGNPGSSKAVDFSSLEGAVIVADDGEFLGKVSTSSTDPQSIGNTIGRFGSEIARTSIFNQIGRYGGEISRMSPFNEITSVPPKIFRGNTFVAYLTVNQIKTPRIDPRALIGWIRANQ
jgi:hypothetical protein